MLVTKDFLSVGGVNHVDRTGLPCLPCKYDGSVAHRSSGYPQVTLCLTCKTKNHMSIIGESCSKTGVIS